MENRLRLENGDEPQHTSQLYRELIGCLMYVTLTTRPNLSAAVNYFSQFQSCPTEKHWTFLTVDVGLKYKCNDSAPLLVAFWGKTLLKWWHFAKRHAKVYGSIGF